ncbi:MAG: Crp/Fnr family transcriptional regulator [Betaproteobacteria bacterium]
MATPEIPARTFLSNLALFRDMDPAELDRLAAGSRSIAAAKGEVLFHKGDACNGFHIILYGQVKLAFTSSQGAEKVIEILGPGMSFGEALMFIGSPYGLFAQALVDTLLLYVDKHTVFAEIERDPKFARKMIGSLCRRLHALVSDVESYSLRSGTERVIGYLLGCDPQAGPATSPLSVCLPASKTIIASRLNLTPEHFSRILHELAGKGLLVIDGRAIAIPDLERLRGYEP